MPDFVHFRATESKEMEISNVPFQYSVLGFILQNLKESVQCNSELIGGVSKSVKGLCGDPDTLRAFIKEYYERRSNSQILEKLANEIRNVVYQAEDAIETYIVLESKHKGRRTIGVAADHIGGYVSDALNATKQIEDVCRKLKEIYQIKTPLDPDAMQVGQSSKRIPKKEEAVTEEEDNVVGLDDEAKNVIELLTEGSQELEVISVIGMHGLGKTTLAKKILNDPTIEFKFYSRAFVEVSQEFERREVFLHILGAFTKITEEIKDLSDDKLVKELHRQLKTRKYLIVLDDVWTPEGWDQLKVAFPNNDKQSRILITSHNEPVAFHANPSCDPHYLRCLDLEDSRELLRKKVFGKSDCPGELEKLELSILLKCDGLPLAIVILAGVLLNYRDRTDWWKKVTEDLDHFVAKHPEQSHGVIRLSYEHLPPHLKPCFLYLGVFREDIGIPVWKLLQLWIAEGFVQKDHAISLEEKAEAYLDDLVSRNLVMVGQRGSSGRIKTCRIHDSLRDFCRREAMKENLFQEVERYDQSTFSTEHTSLDNACRLCMNFHLLDGIENLSGIRVRSFLSFAKKETKLLPEHISCIPRAFKLLRVLDVRPIIFTRFPGELVYLVLLRYIALSSRCKILPEKMSNLQILRTVIFETSWPTLEIKADIWKMPQLRHLITNTSACLPLPLAKIHKGEPSISANLQTLSSISPESCKRDVFERVPKLKKLGICGRLASFMQGNNESSLFDSFSKLEFLENLKLINADFNSKLHFLPHESKFPRSLTRLTLLNTMLDWKHMSILGKLENLEVLKLKDNAFEGERWQTEEGGFLRLQVLNIGSTSLVTWNASASDFPRLRCLVLMHCSKLEAIPHGLAQIASLQAVEVYCTSNAAASSAKKIQAVKLESQSQQPNTGTKSRGFKLSVYPPEE
ncbi:putative late blight resistance protein homolog R1A-10 [Coffea arabica]|uniref:Late blight resistance protein homolog R1A-10 n=1 Tax=Coffea arabica TaxID=13443 RepID=A0A6P6UZS1_COFAR|nr:putative late blight resistance protein homolog R1A-10 [Coffea arabica]